MTKNMAAIFVAIMLLAQIGIARHNTVHFLGHGHVGHQQHDDDQDHHQNASEACQICLSVKAFSYGLIGDQVSDPFVFVYAPFALAQDNQLHSKPEYLLYGPRGPPILLI